MEVEEKTGENGIIKSTDTVFINSVSFRVFSYIDTR